MLTEDEIKRLALCATKASKEIMDIPTFEPGEKMTPEIVEYIMTLCGTFCGYIMSDCKAFLILFLRKSGVQELEIKEQVQSLYEFFIEANKSSHLDFMKRNFYSTGYEKKNFESHFRAFYTEDGDK